MKGKHLSLEEAAGRDCGLAFGYKILKGKRVAIYRTDAFGVTTYTIHALSKVRDYLKIRFMIDPAARVQGTSVEMLANGRLRVKDGPSQPKVGRKPQGDEPMTTLERVRRHRARRREEAAAKASASQAKGLRS